MEQIVVFRYESVAATSRHELARVAVLLSDIHRIQESRTHNHLTIIHCRSSTITINAPFERVLAHWTSALNNPSALITDFNTEPKKC